MAMIFAKLFCILAYFTHMAHLQAVSGKDYIEPPENCAEDGWPDATKATLDKPFSPEEIAAGRKVALEAHNTWRQLHGVPPLRLDDEQNAKAQHFADCAIKWGSWGSWPLGQNRLRSNTGNMSDLAQKATDQWYGYFCRDADDPLLRNGWTRVVWRSTTLLGIGFARSTNKESVIVARYYSYPENYGAGVKKEEVGRVSAAVDNVVCCRTKDPSKGRPWREIGLQDHEECIPTQPDPTDANNGGDNNGGNNGGNNDVGGNNDSGGNNDGGRIWPWPKWRTGQEIPGFGGLGMWGYSGFYSESNKTLWDS